jgi:hypothetical protein
MRQRDTGDRRDDRHFTDPLGEEPLWISFLQQDKKLMFSAYCIFALPYVLPQPQPQPQPPIQRNWNYQMQTHCRQRVINPTPTASSKEGLLLFSILV